MALNVNRDFKEYAENHIHLGGSNDESLNMMALFSQPTNENFYSQGVFKFLPRINEFSYINNGNLSFGILIDIAKYCISVINSELIFKTQKRNIKRDLHLLAKYGKVSLVNVDFTSFDMLEQFMNNGLKTEDEILRELFVYKKKGYTSKVWFLYNILLFKTHSKSKNTDIRRVIKVFLHITNILRSYMIMSQNTGLSHFSEFFGSKVRKVEKQRHNNIASNIIGNGTTKVEAKLSPNAVVGRDKEYISYKLAFDKEIIKKESAFLEYSHQKYFLDTNKAKRNYHFCVHFVRRDDTTKNHIDTPYIFSRHHKLRNSLKKEAKKLNDFLYSESNIINKYDFYKKYYHNLTRVEKNKKHLENSYIDLSKLITTIDVAGDENKTPPEVYAPVIKYLRRDIKKLDDFKAHYIKYQRDGHEFAENYKLRISVHAGEDFNHIITGMRKVYESVKFYKMGHRDRLGHALAIGIEPKEWCEQNGDIFVSKQEHLDNLVWLYYQSIEVISSYKNAQQLRLKYEKIIKKLYEKIYKSNHNHLSDEIDDIYKAWKLREFCPNVMFENNESLNKADEYLKIADFDESKLCKDDYKEAKKIYEKYHNCSKVRKKGDEIIKIEYANINDNYFEYCINDEDLELIEAVQDRLIQKLCDKGIIIETNPSSNVYISYIDSFEKHPIYRWNPIEDQDLEDSKKFNKYGIRTSRLEVCVNTDDPAIMPTTLRNEFEVIENSALKHSDSQENIKNWSENIRLLGLDIFDYDHQRSEFKRV